jgi:hypothetical protein
MKVIVSPCQALFVTLLAASAGPAVHAGDIKIEFRLDGRCMVTMRDESSRSDRVVDVPGAASPSSEYRCAILSPPRGRPIQLSVLLPQGETPAGAEFPRVAWTERAGRWIGTASLPAAPAFVRVPTKGSAAAGRARALDWTALAATAIAIGWSILRSR